mgnify:CR=1 FL=1
MTSPVITAASDVPIPIPAMEEAIKQWRIHRQEELNISIFRVQPGHECTGQTCTLFNQAMEFYGCNECGNYHFCRGKNLTQEIITTATRGAKNQDMATQRLRITYGIWCQVIIGDDEQC